MKQRDEVYACITQLYNSGEIVVVHPEGERRNNQRGGLSPSILNNLTKLETPKDPLFVPLDIVYEEGKIRGRITLTVGEPLRTRSTKELVERLYRDIPSISKSEIPTKKSKKLN